MKCHDCGCALSRKGGKISGEPNIRVEIRRYEADDNHLDRSWETLTHFCMLCEECAVKRGLFKEA